MKPLFPTAILVPLKCYGCGRVLDYLNIGDECYTEESSSPKNLRHGTIWCECGEGIRFISTKAEFDSLMR